MSCESGCFLATVNQCSDITIRAGFPANYPLYYTVQKMGKKTVYSNRVNTENNGDLVILADKLPLGFMFAGDRLKIEVKVGTDFLQPVLMVFDGVQYPCIMVELLNIVGDDIPDDAVITGSIADVPDGPGTPYLIPITSEDFETADDPAVPSPDIYMNSALDGKALAIFWNDVPRYLQPSEWEHVDGGIRILVPGFDATANAYSLFIYIIGNINA